MTIKGITRIPFLTTTGKAYQINDTIELNKKSFIELEEMGLITRSQDSNEKKDKTTPPTEESVNNKDSNEEELEDNKDSNKEELENNEELTNEKKPKNNENKKQK